MPFKDSLTPRAMVPTWRHVWSSGHNLCCCRLNSNALTWDTKVNGRVALAACRFDRLLNGVKLLRRSCQEDVKGYAATLCSLKSGSMPNTQKATQCQCSFSVRKALAQNDSRHKQWRQAGITRTRKSPSCHIVFQEQSDKKVRFSPSRFRPQKLQDAANLHVKSAVPTRDSKHYSRRFHLNSRR